MAQSKTFLILGGARSGKSRYAQDLAEEMAQRAASPPCFLATAEALDDEMDARITRHKADRGPHWTCVEEPLDLADAINGVAAGSSVILVDCLTLWLSNLMHHGRDLDRETDALLTALSSAKCPVVLVSNEVGLGLVPETPLGRAFRDAQGRLNQQVAKACNEAVFIAAGLPMVLKSAPNH